MDNLIASWSSPLMIERKLLYGKQLVNHFLSKQLNYFGLWQDDEKILRLVGQIIQTLDFNTLKFVIIVLQNALKGCGKSDRKVMLLTC